MWGICVGLVLDECYERKMLKLPSVPEAVREYIYDL